jgi:hypothetical protein
VIVLSSLRPHFDAHRVIAIALVLWLGVVACLVGCEMTAAGATSAGAQVSQESESCSMGAGNACCHAQRKDSHKPRADTPTQSNDSMTCCPLAGQSVVAASKSRIADTLGITLTPDSFTGTHEPGITVVVFGQDARPGSRRDVSAVLCIPDLERG